MGASFEAHDEVLTALVAKLDNPQGVLAGISRDLAEEVINLVREGWEGQHDPYGSAWAPKASPDGSAILVRTAALRNSFNVQGADAAGFTVSAGVAYAGFHQGGTRRMPARKMVPDGDIPDSWATRFGEVIEEHLDDLLG